MRALLAPHTLRRPGETGRCAVTPPPAMAAAALTAAAGAWVLTPEPLRFTGALIAAAIPALIWIDLDVSRLPDHLTTPLSLTTAAGLSLTAALTGDPGPLARAAAGALAAAAIMFVLCLAVNGGPGLGDVKLTPALAATLAWHSWHALAVWALLAVGINAIAGILLVLTKRIDRHAALPFGPAMMTAWYGAFLIATAPR